MGPGELLDGCQSLNFSGPIFRAIYTSFPTRNLYSDIGFREGDPDYEIAMALADADVTIDFNRPQQHRPFQYSDYDNFLRNYTSEIVAREDLLYPLRNAQKGRFSDGSFGVFYAAAEESTSLAEVAFHFVEDCHYEMRTSPDVFTSREVDKRIVQLEISNQAAKDFRGLHAECPDLTSDSLEYCQEVGMLVRKRDIPLILTPSARATGGTCTPVFSESALPSAQTRTIRYYHFKYDREGLKVKKSDVNQTDWAIPGSWKI